MRSSFSITSTSVSTVALSFVSPPICANRVSSARAAVAQVRSAPSDAAISSLRSVMALEPELDGDIGSALIMVHRSCRSENISQVEIGRHDRDVTIRCVGNEKIPGRAFVIGPEVIVLAAKFTANGQFAREHVTHRRLETERRTIVFVAAKSEQPELVGLAVSQGDVHQQALRQEYLGASDVVVDAVIVAGAELRRALEWASVVDTTVSLDFRTQRNLRKPRVLAVDCISGHSNLQPENILGNLDAFERGAGDVELVACRGDLEPIEQPNSHAKRPEGEITEPDVGHVRICAPAYVGAITCDQGPGHQAAAAHTLDITESGGEQ